MYSVGLPPEFIGMRALSQLNEEEWTILRKHYLKIEPDLKLVGEYVSCENINMLIEMRSQTSKRANMNQEQIKKAFTNILEDLKAVEEKLGIKLGPKGISERKHENFTNNFLSATCKKKTRKQKEPCLNLPKSENA